MNRLILLMVVAFSTSFVFAQGQVADDSLALNKKVAELYGQGKFDEAIPIAETVVTNEKKRAKDSETHAIALMNLGMLHKERLRLSLKEDKPAKSENVTEEMPKRTCANHWRSTAS